MDKKKKNTGGENIEGGQEVVLSKKKMANILAKIESEELGTYSPSSPIVNLDNLNEKQVDALLKNIHQSEKSEHEFRMAKLGATKEVALKSIQASNMNDKTNQYLKVGGLMVACLVTILILVYKDTFFIPWLTFLTGIAGGFGLGKVSSKSDKNTIKSSMLNEVENFDAF